MDDLAGKGFWLTTIPYAPNPALQGECRADVVVVGGRDLGFYFGLNTEQNKNEAIFSGLKSSVRRIFPVLEDVEFSHEWGGPISIPLDMAPALGYAGDRRVVYSLGGMGKECP